MPDIYIWKPGGEDAEESRRRREAEREQTRRRYIDHLVKAVNLDRSVAERTIAVLFDHRNRDDDICPCGCHPSFSSLHDDGFDCPCGWDGERRAKEAEALKRFFDSAEAEERREAHAFEDLEIAAWVASQPSVEAERVSEFVVEQWKGSVDGHSFYFRERHGLWQIELDLEPTGDLADRLVGVENGEFVTEPVPMVEGEVIAEGAASQLGESWIDHISFIVRTIRDHHWARDCDHLGALLFCPKCGERM